MSDKPIDWSRPVRTDEEEPRPGRLICTDFEGTDFEGTDRRTHILLVRGRCTLYQYICFARPDGSTLDGYRWVNVPEKHTLQVKLHKFESGDWGYEIYIDGKPRGSYNRGGKILCSYTTEIIEFTEGEGL